ncbi:hypothetical protein P154DRAFT_150908 [Amniculicola lignicola CBS 123094]|uniref:Uncharacterized protein n=1 Tax=Amniculicola lignicola CBS 123094 TaxID=1392246 RepID=A0A6A5WSL6_9PLEO|nr:hypothetical protein P154DRAFT_150908 [Amniculicola lignicola CBS 123094]
MVKFSIEVIVALILGTPTLFFTILAWWSSRRHVRRNTVSPRPTNLDDTTHRPSSFVTGNFYQPPYLHPLPSYHVNHAATLPYTAQRSWPVGFVYMDSMFRNPYLETIPLEEIVVS